MTGPDLSFEMAAWERGASRVAGVDEVGRGPWAGPVTIAAVILDPANIPAGLNDSKKLTKKQREALYPHILRTAEVAIVDMPVADIDATNILAASLEGMRRAVARLSGVPDHLLIDGNRMPDGLSTRAECLVGGDGRSLSIAAASIVAKVWRDRLMVDLAQQHPGYGWERNAGYGTPEHRLGLERHGVSPHHRRSFKPIHNILWQAKNPSD